jgi:thiol-disulfide isomerase/thioredoxin
MQYKKRYLTVAGLLILFCIGFSIFFNLFLGKAEERPKQPSLPETVLHQPLPDSSLTELSGAVLDNSELRRGKVMLVLMTSECPLCVEEGQFLRTVIGKRDDVRFYGVVPYGTDKEVLREAADKFPFKLFFDEGYRLRRALKINRVPVKIYLEDGIIKKTWVGSTPFFRAEAEFGSWLESLN